MTVAVCIRCGALKHGALTPCPKCRFDPERNEDKAKAMVLTDHWLPEEELGRISERIKSELPVTYPEDMVRQYVEFFEKGIGLPLTVKIGCAAVAVCLTGFVVWLIARNT